MIDIGERGNFGGYLSQLKKISESAGWRTNHTRYRFFVFGMLGAGFLGMLAWLPLQPSAPLALADNQAEAPDQEEERCRWQKDVAFFSALGENGGRLTQDQTTCEKKKKEEKSPVSEKDSVSGGMEERNLNQAIRELAVGYPIETMAPAIARYDREVAALIVGIAKKESNWGKRVPRAADGSDCFNYWGYKGAGTRGIAMGHGCFGSPEEAVEAVGNRLARLVALRQTSEPKNMIIWKCGSSCKGHSQESVTKWISDVDRYYRRIAEN